MLIGMEVGGDGCGRDSAVVGRLKRGCVADVCELARQLKDR